MFIRCSRFSKFVSPHRSELVSSLKIRGKDICRGIRERFWRNDNARKKNSNSKFLVFRPMCENIRLRSLFFTPRRRMSYPWKKYSNVASSSSEISKIMERFIRNFCQEMPEIQTWSRLCCGIAIGIRDAMNNSHFRVGLIQEPSGEFHFAVRWKSIPVFLPILQ